MMALADALRDVTAACDEEGHPLDLWRVLEPAYLQAAATVGRTRSLSSPIPKLCTLVVASPFDAAIHDAYGKAFGVSSYATYSKAHVRQDLSRDLGPAVRGRIPGSLHPVRAARRHAGVPFGRRERCHRARGPQGAARRRPAEHAGGVDCARRPDALQDQAQWRQLTRRTSIASPASTASCARRCRRVVSATGTTCWISTRAARTWATCSACCGACARRHPMGSPGSSTWSSRRRATSPTIAAT